MNKWMEGFLDLWAAVVRSPHTGHLGVALLTYGILKLVPLWMGVPVPSALTATITALGLGLTSFCFDWAADILKTEVTGDE